MTASTEQIEKVPLEQMDWKEVLEHLKKTQDMWWLNEIVVDGKKKTKLEVALKNEGLLRRKRYLKRIWKLSLNLG